MYGNDTGSLQVVRFEHLDVKTVTRLNRFIGVVKLLFRGNAHLLLVLSGGRIDVMRIGEARFDDEQFKDDK